MDFSSITFTGYPKAEVPFNRLSNLNIVSDLQRIASTSTYEFNDPSLTMEKRNSLPTETGHVAKRKTDMFSKTSG
jgi:hypothetical protein